MNRKRLVGVVAAGSLAALGLAGTALAAGNDDSGLGPAPKTGISVGTASSAAPSATARKAGDDHGRRTEAGDDHGRGTEAGDDRGRRSEPGDDHGRHGGKREAGDDHGSGGHGSDD